MEEAEEVLPAQEVELLLRQHIRVRAIENGEKGAAGVSGEPLSDVPKEFT
jgi:TPP-dependent indolepyruvate ferredoxin oxidoreductase alpha subunit